MLLISLARHSSSMPMQHIAFQRQCETQQCSSVACRINALASLCTCFFAPRFSAPLHVLWPLIPRSAGHIPAIPQHVLASHRQCLSSLRHCQSMPFFSVAVHSFAVAELSRSVPLLSASVPQQIGASPLQIWAVRSCSIARLVFAQRTVQLPSLPFRRSSARYTSMQFLGHSRHCHAEAARVMSSP